MKSATFCAVSAFVSLSLATSFAAAQAGRSGFGVGAEVTTTGITGGTFVYDPGPLHLDFLLGARFNDSASNVAAGARLFFPLHRTQSADFSLGPGIGIVHSDTSPPNNAPGNSYDQCHLEGAGQIRAFLVPNVAFSGSAGLGLVFEPGGPTFSLGGTVGASFGITYFFY